MSQSVSDKLPAVVASTIADAMLEGLGLFDAAERFGVRPYQIVASVEESLTRRYVRGLRRALQPAKRRAAIRVEVPHWVPTELRRQYQAIAAEQGEEEAASVIRALKKKAA